MLSRAEINKQNRIKRKARLKRRVILNLSLLGIIVVLIGVFFLMGNNDLIGSLRGSSENSKNIIDGNTVLKPDEAGSEEDGGVSDESDGSGKDTEDEEAITSPDDPGAERTEDEDEPAVATTPAPNEERTVSLSFVGDILLGPYVEDVIRNHGHDYLYEQTSSYLSKAHITAGNLEAPITTIDNPFPNKDYVYKASPDTLPALKASGVDIVSLANNHTLDHGAEGMRDTIRHLNETGIAHMGAGENDTEAYASFIAEGNGISVAYIGVSEVIFSQSMKADKNVPGVAEAYDPTRIVKAIEAADEKADLVVVMPHWGEMNTVVLEKKQVDLAKAFIDAGADLVIGSHPHVLQGFEMYKGKWIAYSLGNFIFGVGPKGEERETAVLDAVCTKNGDCELQLHPMFVENGQPKPMEQEEGYTLLNRLMAISPGLRFEKDGSIREE